MVGFNTVFPRRCDVVFKIRNIAPDNKRIRVFNYPIANGFERDLMLIPYVSETDIKHSLLKGELLQKGLAGEYVVVESNIDLIQFNDCQRDFLESLGVKIGLTAGTDGYDGYSTVDYLFRQNVELVGPKNNANRIFSVFPGDKFINGIFDDNDFRIIIMHNGRRLIENIDYIVLESGGPGTGFDQIRIISFVPNPKSQLFADYVVENT